MGSSHVLCPCWYGGTSQICVTATAQSVGHFVGCVSRGVEREISITLAVGWPCQSYTEHVLSPFLLLERVVEHVFYAPHVHIRHKPDLKGLWTIFSLGARRAILSSETSRGT